MIAPGHGAFVGRVSELTHLRALLDARVPLITLLGTGGCGKTRLAIELARAVAHEFEHVAVADLTDAQTPLAMATVIGQALDLPLIERDPVAQIGHAIAGRGRGLIVLDNVEHLVAHVASTLTPWLAQTPLTSWLITSRHRLELTSEHVLTIDPLPPPQHDTPSALATNDAAQLFVARARAHVPQFTIDPRNAADIAALLRTLDGLPLAIELAAARVRVLTPKKMLERMHRRFEILKRSRRDLNPRQNTLQGALEWSWDLLEPWEQSTLAQLSVFEGGFTLEAAEAVVKLDDDDLPFIIDILESLVDKSLVRTLPSDNITPHRFHLLVSVQAFASTKLKILPSLSESKNSPQKRHGAFYAEFGTPASMAALDRHGGITRLRALQAERDNLVAAAHAALERRDYQRINPLAIAASAVFQATGPFAEGAAFIASLLAAPALPDAQRATLRGLHGELGQRAGLGDTCLTDLNAALSHAERSNATPDIVHWLNVLGTYHTNQGRLDAATPVLERARTLALALSDHHQAAVIDATLINIRHRQGKVDHAYDHLVAALSIIRDQGDQRNTCIHTCNLAILCKQQGRLTEARQHYDRALDLAQQLRDHRLVSAISGNLAILQAEQGDHEGATTRLTQALLTARHVGNRRLEGGWLSNLAMLLASHDQLEQARQHLIDAIDLARLMNDQRSEGIRTGQLAEIDQRLQATDRARQGFERALAVAQACEDQRFQGIWHRHPADIAWLEGRIDHAQHPASQSETLLRAPPARPALATPPP